MSLTTKSRYSYQFVSRYLAVLSLADFLPKSVDLYCEESKQEGIKLALGMYSPKSIGFVVLLPCDCSGTAENSDFFKKAASEDFRSKQ